MTFLDDLGKGVSHLADPITTPIKGLESVVTTVHNDVKGITKGGYKIASGLTKDIGTGFTQLTSPVGLISIAVILGVVIFATRSK